MTESKETAPAGWYAAPRSPNMKQWWDGTRWTPNYGGSGGYRSLGVAYAFLFLLGIFGAHRLYLRKYWTAVLMVVLWFGGGFVPVRGAWWFMFLPMAAGFMWLIVDIFRLPLMVRTENAKGPRPNKQRAFGP